MFENLNFQITLQHLPLFPFFNSMLCS